MPSEGGGSAHHFWRGVKLLPKGLFHRLESPEASCERAVIHHYWEICRIGP